MKPFDVRSIIQKDNLIAFGSLKEVAIWDMDECETLLQGHSDLVQGVCFTSDASRLISASQGIYKNLIVWDLKLKCELSYLEGHLKSVFCVDVTSDDKNLISGDWEGRVLFWDLLSYKQICEFEGHTEQVYSVKFTKNKKFAASCGGDEKIIVWDIENQVQYAVLSGHENSIWKVSITNDDRFIVSGCFTDGIRVWSIEEKRQVFGFKSLDESRDWLAMNKDKRSEFSRFLF